jgi:tRNA(Ile)-lysidine synthase
MGPDPVGEVERCLLPNPPAALGIAVSGGGDSLALLHILHRLAKTHSISLHAATVDHGLRPGSAEEAAHVSQVCADLGVPHAILEWQAWSGQGNLQNAARNARYRLLRAWAEERGLQAIALGHTADDQAETVLMRLARGAGVDGLSAMAETRMNQGVKLMRPLLGVTRDTLRNYLREHDLVWVEDPSNDDMQFDRIKFRQAMQVLEPLGITAASLGQVAFNMARARDALNWQTFLDARRILRADAGTIRMDRRAYRTLPDEIARRLLVHALGWVGGADYPPRRAAVLRLIEMLKRDSGGTLDGCQVRRVGEVLWVFREYNAVKDLRAPLTSDWDNRWRFRGGHADPGFYVAALGEDGLLQCPEWRSAGRPRDMLMATPAIWKDAEIVSAPLANHAQGWQLELKNGDDAFFAALLSH